MLSGPHGGGHHGGGGGHHHHHHGGGGGGRWRGGGYPGWYGGGYGPGWYNDWGPIVLEEESPIIYVVDESDPSNVREGTTKHVRQKMTPAPWLRSMPVSGLGLWLLETGRGNRPLILQNSPRGGRYYGTGFSGVAGSVSDTSQNVVMAAFDKVLPANPFPGDTDQQRAVSGAARARDILVKYGYDPIGVDGEGPPPKVGDTIASVMTESVALSVLSVLFAPLALWNIYRTYSKLSDVGADDAFVLAAWMWRVSADDTMMRVYAQDGLDAYVSSGIMTPEQAATDLRRRLLVFRTIDFIEQQGWWRRAAEPQASSAMRAGKHGFGEVPVPWGWIIAGIVVLLAILLWLHQSGEQTNALIKANCVENTSKLPEEDRVKFCTGRIPGGAGDVADKMQNLGYALIAGGLIYAFVVYGLPHLMSGSSEPQRAFAQNSRRRSRRRSR